MIDETEIRKLKEQYGTPFYLFDIDSLSKRVHAMQEITEGKYQLCYSIKANPFLVPFMSRTIGKLEVCSPGELDLCRYMGVPSGQIVYSGVNKTKENIDDAYDYHVGIYTAESLKHVLLLNEKGKQQNTSLPVLLRLNAKSQFGMSKEDLLSVIEKRDSYSGIRIMGIHYFAGTQRKKLEWQKKELEMLRELFQVVKDVYGYELKYLEYGPGLPVPLFEPDDFSDTLKPLKELNPLLQEVSTWCTLTVEMGRFFAAECGSYVTEVQDLKSAEEKNYAIVDGGIHHLNYLGQIMGMKNPVFLHLHSSDHDQERKEWCVCGSLCTTNDVLMRSCQMTGLSMGDLLLFENTGAYSITEAMYLFLSRTMPAVVLWEGGKPVLAREHLETSTINRMRGENRNGRND